VLEEAGELPDAEAQWHLEDRPELQALATVWTRHAELSA